MSDVCMKFEQNLENEESYCVLKKTDEQVDRQTGQIP